MTLRSLNALLIALFVLVSSGPVQAQEQETEAATRQYAVAVGFQNQKLFDAAIDEWQTFLEKFPKDPRVDRAHHYLGTCSLQEKQYADAIAAFRTVLKDYPKCELLDQSTLNLGIAWYGQAQKSGKDNDYQNAERAFGQMLAKFGDSEYAARALYYRGECLYQLKQVDKAAAAYDQFVKKYPDHELAADAIYALGTAQEVLKHPEQALASFSTFATKFPKHELVTEVQMRRGEILFDNGKFVDANPVFEAVSGKRDFELADVAMLRNARCLYELGRVDEAAKLYWNVPREFKNTKHYDAAILAGAKCYFLQEKYKLARTGLEQVMKRDSPEAPEATQWMARCLLKEGDAKQALQVAEQGLQMFKGDAYRPELDLVRIDAMYELPQQREKSADQYAKFVRRNPKADLAPQAQYMAALASLDVKNYAAAKGFADDFVEPFRDSKLMPDVMFIAAESRLLLGEHKTAAERFRAFLQAAPDHANAEQAKVRCGLALSLADEHDNVITWLTGVVPQLQDPSLKSEALSILGRTQLEKGNAEAGAETLNQAIATKPDRPGNDEAYLALAEAYRKLGRSDEADKQLQMLQTSFPESRLASEVDFRIAEAAYGAERFKDAMQAYQRVVANHPDSDFAPHAQYGLGWTLFNLGEYQKSSAALTTLLEKYQSSSIAPKGLYVRAMAAYQLGDFASVLKDVQAFEKTKPAKNDRLDAEYVKGLAEAGQKKFDAAAKTYQNILSDSKDYGAADKVAYELGWAYVELGNTDKAVATFGQLARTWPDSPLAAEALFRVGEAHYNAKQFPEAAKAYQRSAAKSGEGEIAEKSMHKLGWSLLKADDLPGAQTAFAEQLQKHPEGELAGDARFLVGECLYKQKNWAEAWKAFEAVAAAGDSNYGPLAMFRAGECAASLDDWAGSKAWHQKVLTEHPDFEMKAEARYGVAWAIQNEGKFDQAIPLYEQVTEETDTETAAKARFMIGECCFAQKQHKDATKHFLKTAFLYNHREWSAMAYFEAARCFEVLKDVEQAKTCYEKLIAKYPQHKKVQDAKRRIKELQGA